MQIDGSLAPREDASLTGQNLWNWPNWVFRYELPPSLLDGKQEIIQKQDSGNLAKNSFLASQFWRMFRFLTRW
jgi:hypothetical protein